MSEDKLENFEWDVDKFYDTIKVWNTVLMISIPKRLVVLGQYQKGDILEVWIRKKKNVPRKEEVIEQEVPVP
jgi:hypothetical protein